MRIIIVAPTRRRAEVAYTQIRNELQDFDLFTKMPPVRAFISTAAGALRGQTINDGDLVVYVEGWGTPEMLREWRFIMRGASVYERHLR